MAGGTDLLEFSVMHVSETTLSLKGGCAENLYFCVSCGMFEPKMFFLHGLFQIHLKPNDSDVEALAVL